MKYNMISSEEKNDVQSRKVTVEHVMESKPSLVVP